MSEEQDDVAGVIAFPPLLYAGALAAGLLLDRGSLPAWSRRAAPPLLLAGLALTAAATVAMKRAGTPLDVERPTTALVTDGPFRFTRNPIYLSFALIYAGIASAARSRLALLLLAPLSFVVERGVIEPEERYLERRFGDAYRAYTARVRRWL